MKKKSNFKCVFGWFHSGTRLRTRRHSKKYQKSWFYPLRQTQCIVLPKWTFFRVLAQWCALRTSIWHIMYIVIIVNDYMETAVDFFSESETIFMQTFFASFLADVSNDGKNKGNFVYALLLTANNISLFSINIILKDFLLLNS